MITQGNKASGRRERKKADMRRRIVDVAMTLFEKQGYEETLMDQIGDEVDIAKTTIYRYFPSKEAIVAAFVQQSIEDQYEETSRRVRKLPDVRSRLIALYEQSLDWSLRHKDLWLIYYSYRMQRLVQGMSDEADRSGHQKIVEETILAGQKSGEIREDLPASAIGALFQMNFGPAITWLVTTQTTKSPKKFVASLVDVLLNGVTPRQANT